MEVREGHGAASANIVQEGVDRFRDAFGSVEGEFERIQKQLRARRRSLEKQLNTSRRDFDKRARKVRAEIRRSSTMKQIERWRKDATKQLEQGVDNILGALKIASKSDVQRIDRKISQINRKMKEIERRKRSNGQAAA
jgi:hypothetical protein